VIRRSNGTNGTVYLLKDHLGSVEVLTNSSGAQMSRLAYGAQGPRRDGVSWGGTPSTTEWTTITNTTRWGFTSHEMLDNLSLIHMNGRVYDPNIGRFLSADPFVQAPGFTQSFNRYSYVWNNPHKYTDPSGFLGAEIMCRGINSASRAGAQYCAIPTPPGPVTPPAPIPDPPPPSVPGTDNGHPADTISAGSGERCVFTAGMVTCGTGGSELSREFQWGVADVLIGTAGFAFGWDGAEFREHVFKVPPVDPNSRDYQDGVATGVVITFGLGRLAAMTAPPRVLGKASFTAKNGIGQIYSPEAVLAGDTLILNDLAVGTARGLIGVGSKGAAELLGPMRELVRFGQQNGARVITINGRYVSEEGAALGGGKVGDTFSFTFTADEAGLRQLIQQLGRKP